MSSRQSSSSGAGGSAAGDVARAVSQAEGTDDAELRPPLESVIDMDALDRLVRSTDWAARVSFRYRDWTAEVRGGDRVAVASVPDDE